MMVSRRKCVPQFQCSLIVVSMSVIPVAPQLWGNGNAPRKKQKEGPKNQD